MINSLKFISVKHISYLISIILIALSVTESAQAAVHQISSGFANSHHLKANGTLWAWGRNDFGQLGDGTNVPKNLPIQMNSDTDWTNIATGYYHTLAIKENNTLWAWGLNDYGQLGDGTYDNQTAPVQIGTDTDWTSITAGERYTLAIKTNGTLWAWGGNHYGQLGDSTNDDKNAPVQVDNDTDWTTIAAGEFHSLAIKTDNTLWAWGRNFVGQLGDGTNEDKNAPIQVDNDTDWTTIAAGGYFSLAIKTDNTLWAWGRNTRGELGDGTNDNKNSPVQIGTDSDWATIAAGRYHSLAIKSDGTLWAWGKNDYGQLGDGTNVEKNAPVLIGTDTDWASVDGGTFHSLAIKTDNTVWTWGRNYYGQLGDGTDGLDGTEDNKNYPIMVSYSGTITGTVSGYVLESISITLDRVTCGAASSDTVTTDENGYYIFMDVLNGNYNVTPEITGYAFSPEQRSVKINDNSTTGVDFTATTDAVVELITHYYSNILGRAPESNALNYYINVIMSIESSGGDIKDGFISMAQNIFNSPEYLNRNRNDEEYVTDLYNTFFDREPDSDGLTYWTTRLFEGMSRNTMLNNFVFSAEFDDFMDETLTVP